MHAASAVRVRDDGYTLRPAVAGDRQSLLDLIALQHDASDVPEAAMVFDDAEFGPGGWLVAAGAHRVVACIAPFANEVRVGQVAVAGLEIEFVTSHPSVAGRGLVRDLFALMDVLHPDRLGRLMVGIPYFYRRLGYEYAIPTPTELTFAPDTKPPLPDGWHVTEADRGDADEIEAAQRAVSAEADVAFSHDATKWRWLLASPNYTTLRLTGPAGPAYARVHRWQDDAYAFDVVAASVDALRAVVAATAARVSGSVSVLVRPGWAQLADQLGDPATQDYAYYAQVSDPLAMLEALRPTLSARLSRSPLRSEVGDALLSLYGSSIRFAYDNGRVGAMEPGPAVHAPVSAGGAGVPPDRIAELIFGPGGFDAMSRRYPDVLADAAASSLMSVLFPPQTVDVQTWVYP